MANAETYSGSSATAIAIHNDPSALVEITTGREPVHVLLLDPYSGTVIGESAPRLRAFFTQVTALHRWFGMQGPNRTIARTIKAYSPRPCFFWSAQESYLATAQMDPSACTQVTTFAA
jgi:hypothetical protein